MAELPLLSHSLSTRLSELRRLAQRMGLDVKGLAPQAIADRVTEALSTQHGVERLIDSCSAPAQELLFDIAWHGQGMLPGRAIDGPGGHNPRAAVVRELCEELRAAGLVYSLGYQDYWAAKPGYHMAYETAVWVGPVLAARAGVRTTHFFYSVEGSVADGASLDLEWLMDLVRVLGELARKPAGITQAGSIYRRDADRLRRCLTPRRLEDLSPAWTKTLALLPDPASFGPWAEEAQPDIGLLLWLGFALGLLHVQDGGIAPVEDWRKRLARRKVGEVWLRAVRAVWQLHARSLTAAFWFRFLSPDDWLVPGRLLSLTEAREGSLFGPAPANAVTSLLRCMAQLGALEAGTVVGEPAVRLMPVGGGIYGQPLVEPALAGQWSILPNGDILVPPDLPPARLAWLETVARPVKVDVVCTYQVSQESLHQAIEMGVKPDDVLAELEAGSRTGLPQVVRFRVEEWLGRVGRYRFVEAALLVCRTREDAEAALGIRAVRQEVIEVLGETCLVIRADHEEKVRSALERGGLASLSGVFSPSGLYREDALRERRKAMRILRSLDWGAGTVVEAL